MAWFKSAKPKGAEGMAPSNGVEASEAEFKEAPAAVLEAWREGVRKELGQVEDTDAVSPFKTFR